jgi:hypothetical protein
MPFRFRKTIRLLPWLRINISKKGASVSAGKPGASVNVSEKGVKGTVGVPGTGVSYSEQLLTKDDWSHNPQPPQAPKPHGRWMLGALVFIVSFAVGFCSAFGAPVVVVPRAVVIVRPPAPAPRAPAPAFRPAPAPIPKAPAPTPKPAPARPPVAEQQPTATVTQQPWFWFWMFSHSPAKAEKCVNTKEQPHRCDERNLNKE